VFVVSHCESTYVPFCYLKSTWQFRIEKNSMLEGRNYSCHWWRGETSSNKGETASIKNMF
jgi:hypothetical protein